MQVFFNLSIANMDCMTSIGHGGFPIEVFENDGWIFKLFLNQVIHSSGYKIAQVG